MKAISLLQPWASLKAVGAKKIETRSWSTKYRGPFAIHASKKFADEQKKLCMEEPFYSALSYAGYKANRSVVNDRVRIDLPVGLIIATCRLVDCVRIIGRTSIAGKIVAAQLSNGQEITGNELAFGDYTPGRFAWITEDAKVLSVPVAVKGSLGLWNWDGGEGSG
ncbi:MAG: ASCH domain-containing protein [Bacillota bacterium]